MARHELMFDVPPAAVFAVLSDPESYARWVVGSREIRTADAGWPAPGTRFGHTVGVPPVTIQDETVVLDADPPRRLELQAKARPLPSARVILELAAEGERTRVTMIEEFVNPVVNRLAGPLGHAAMRLRNRECLRRLKVLAEAG